ncbi:MAG: hypothetical protein WEB00_05110 [Dehalococcoidia bacterium]
MIKALLAVVVVALVGAWLSDGGDPADAGGSNRITLRATSSDLSCEVEIDLFVADNSTSGSQHRTFKGTGAITLRGFADDFFLFGSAYASSCPAGATFKARLLVNGALVGQGNTSLRNGSVYFEGGEGGGGCRDSRMQCRVATQAGGSGSKDATMAGSTLPACEVSVGVGSERFSPSGGHFFYAFENGPGSASATVPVDNGDFLGGTGAKAPECADALARGSLKVDGHVVGSSSTNLPHGYVSISGRLSPLS